MAIRPYDEVGAMGGLFAPAFLRGDPVSEAAVARWLAAHPQKGPPSYTPRSPIDAKRDAIAQALVSGSGSIGGQLPGSVGGPSGSGFTGLGQDPDNPTDATAPPGDTTSPPSAPPSAPPAAPPGIDQVTVGIDNGNLSFAPPGVPGSVAPGVPGGLSVPSPPKGQEAPPQALPAITVDEKDQEHAPFDTSPLGPKGSMVNPTPVAVTPISPDPAPQPPAPPQPAPEPKGYTPQEKAIDQQIAKDINTPLLAPPPDPLSVPQTMVEKGVEKGLTMDPPAVQQEKADQQMQMAINNMIGPMISAIFDDLGKTHYADPIDALMQSMEDAAEQSSTPEGSSPTSGDLGGFGAGATGVSDAGGFGFGPSGNEGGYGVGTSTGFGTVGTPGAGTDDGFGAGATAVGNTADTGPFGGGYGISSPADAANAQAAADAAAAQAAADASVGTGLAGFGGDPGGVW